MFCRKLTKVVRELSSSHSFQVNTVKMDHKGHKNPQNEISGYHFVCQKCIFFLSLCTDIHKYETTKCVIVVQALRDKIMEIQNLNTQFVCAVFTIDFHFF